MRASWSSSFEVYTCNNVLATQQAPPGATMNPGGGNRVSLLEAVATLGELADTEPKLIRQGVEAGDVRDPWARVSCAVGLIGYAPTTHLGVGLAREFAWLADFQAEWS